MPQRIRGPGGGLIRMACGAGIRNLVLVGHRRRYESKRMRAYFHVRNRGFDFRHMAGNATAARRSFFVMGMFLDRSGTGTIQRERAMAIQA